MYLHQKTSDAAYTVAGRNPSVDTALEELTNYGTTLDWTSILSTAAAMDVTSSSAADTSAGTGAQKIRIYGINGSYAQTYEEITMNGQTTVTGTVTFLRVWGVEVVQSGSGKTNAGDIYVVKTGTGGIASATMLMRRV